jgi:hypothetical protein
MHTDPPCSKHRGAYHQGARQVQEENLPEVWEKEVVPPSSPDWNPLNDFVCGVSEL